jgi:hypothetical protein
MTSKFLFSAMQKYLFSYCCRNKGVDKAGWEERFDVRRKGEMVSGNFKGELVWRLLCIRPYIQVRGQHRQKVSETYLNQQPCCGVTSL